LTYLFTATVFGTLPSMKNQRRIVTNRRTGKPFSIKSKVAEAYETSFLHQIRHKAAQEPLSGDLSIKVRVWYPTKRNDLDIEFLKDLLQKGNIVENDRQFVHQEAWKGIDRENPRVIFTIYQAKAGCCEG
jgi:Holliday junction resolvase RusA-like endonuclease